MVLLLGSLPEFSSPRYELELVVDLVEDTGLMSHDLDRLLVQLDESRLVILDVSQHAEGDAERAVEEVPLLAGNF
jgi:hypothetical protein